MNKNIDLIIDGIAPEKVMYDTDNHSLVVLYPAQGEFKKGDILSSLNYEYAMCIYKDKSPTRTGNISTYLGIDSDGKLLPEISNSWGAEATYRHATEEEEQTLFNALAKKGKKWNRETLQVEDLDISEIVYDLPTACEYLGKNIPAFSGFYMNYEDGKKWGAQIELQLMCEAWNKFDGFEVDWENRNQLKYAPMFEVKDGKIEFSGTSFFRVLLDFHTSNFSFKTEERAIQFGKQFKELFREAMGM